MALSIRFYIASPITQVAHHSGGTYAVTNNVADIPFGDAEAVHSGQRLMVIGAAGLGELGKDLADGGGDSFVRVERNLAVLLAPDKADRQAAPEFAACRLIANAAIEARAQYVQLCFAHGALQAQQQPVIEHRRVIEAVAIADQRVGEAGEIDEAIPFGIVAGQARDFQTQHEANTGERHLGSEPGKAGAGRGSATGQAQVFINDDDPFGRPAELAGNYALD